VSTQLWVLLGTFITATAGVTTTWLLIRQQGRQTRTTDAQQIIDQLQENAKSREEQHLREIADRDQRHQQEIGEVRRDLAEVRGRVEGLEDREMAWDDYAAQLRAHIDRGDPPPPPPWPAALMRRRRL